MENNWEAFLKDKRQDTTLFWGYSGSPINEMFAYKIQPWRTSTNKTLHRGQRQEKRHHLIRLYSRSRVNHL